MFGDNANTRSYARARKKEVIVMPEISRFLGIVIYMYFNEHHPPHFHAEYNECKAAIEIKSLGLMKGKLPPKVMSLVVV